MPYKYISNTVHTQTYAQARAHTHTLGADLSVFASDAKKPLRTTKQPAFTDLYSPELHLRSLMLVVLKDCSLPQVWHDAGH